MKTQPARVLEYLKAHPVATTNELRQMSFNQHSPIVDIPKAVSILVDKGYNITSKRNHDGTATYTYNGASSQSSSENDLVVEYYRDENGYDKVRYVPAKVDISSAISNS